MAGSAGSGANCSHPAPRHHVVVGLGGWWLTGGGLGRLGGEICGTGPDVQTGTQNL